MAVRILALEDETLRGKLAAYIEEMADNVEKKHKEL